MAKYEIWGRKEIGKGKRNKLAYGIGSESEAQRLRQDFIDQGFRDCILGRTQIPYAPELAIGGRKSKKKPGAKQV